jgi:succinoglycan biosynthesis transport protein ExoP
MEEEVDLRSYIYRLLKHWKLIVSITVIAGLVVGLVSFLTPPNYEAKAAALITKARYEIVFVPEYKTLSADEAVTMSSSSQREALIALVKSSTVANQVIEQLGDTLDPEEQRVGSITSKIKVENQGDFIAISITSPDPAKAAAIANAWVEAYVSHVNELYSDILQPPAEFRKQANAAKQDYEEQEKIWEDFVGDNRIDELSRQISDKELLCQVKSLRQQFEAGSSSSASTVAISLAFILLQTEAFTSLPAEFQISLDEISGINVSLEDIDALIATLETRSETTPGQSISELRQEVLELRAELAEESARQQDLIRARDTAWQTYTTLDSKAVEVQLAAQAQDGVVQIATVAVVPQKAASTHKAINIGIALVLGLVVGVISAFAIEYFRKPVEKKARVRKS